ncbi:MAG: hypothetical protein QOF41_1339 [Methylobacteriaceae bacterium]|nr:hypothetical protein [Methylobacteriaceae bacterium]
MSFVADNDAYEAWLAKQCAVVNRDVEKKHDRMRESAFMFLRATYFRWAKQMPTLFPDLMKTPAVLSVGDLHSENFGTWRDEDGRLVWGVNDFDEASIIPYAFDLVRLATSVRLAGKQEQKASHRAAATAIIEGYAAGLAKPRPTLLDEKDRWLRRYTACPVSERRKFWKKVAKYPAPTEPIPPAVAHELANRLPSGAENIRYATRSAGGGSLGRPRYVAVADWRGGQVVREAKALVQSAWDWARDNKAVTLYFKQLATQMDRAPDPYLDVKDGFIYRRLAPDSRKVELGEAPEFELQRLVLTQMGFDLGAIHAADANASAVMSDLERRRASWLYDSAKTAAAAVERDYREWCRHHKC